MRARERAGCDYGRKKHIEREMRRFGQALGEIDPGRGTAEGVPDRQRKDEPEDGGDCERVGDSSSPDGTASSLRRGVSVGGGLDGGGEA
jgi:hypothetical protein